MGTAGGFGLNRIGQIAVNVKDLDRAVAFYRHALGMRPLFQVPKLTDHDLWMAFCRDPEGNVLALMSEVRRS
jgi:catechol 2,3-dioxygenase-like lactoylglutathione lyase family enzyme